MSVTEQNEFVYQNSLTKQVQDSVDLKLKAIIASANREWDMKLVADEIQKDLSNPYAQNTPSFIIRRHIQQYLPECIPDDVVVPDLLSLSQLDSASVDWDNDSVARICRNLKRLSDAQGATITLTEWKRYLIGQTRQVRKREKVFMIAFSLKMGVEDTVKLLMAFEQETYSVRYPIDFICLFCQSSQEPYTWSHVEDIYQRFLSGRQMNTVEARSVDDYTEGMTEEFQDQLEVIFDEALSAPDAANALVEYMIAHSGEFVSVQKTKYIYEQENEGERRRAIRIPVVEFIPGYSKSRMDSMMRLAQYLRAVYPYYYRVKPEKIDASTDKYHVSPFKGSDFTGLKEPVKCDGSNVKLPDLARAMLSLSGWDSLNFNHGEGTSVLEEDMRQLCDNYAAHMSSIERFRTGGAGVSFFTRRDALLFIFFLISGYISKEVDTTTHEEIHKRLEPFLNTGSWFDSNVQSALRKAKTAHNEEKDPQKKFDMLRRSFNMLLFSLEYHEIYMPSVLDRLLLLALMSENPNKMAALIMCHVDGNTYESSLLDAIDLTINIDEKLSELLYPDCQDQPTEDNELIETAEEGSDQHEKEMKGDDISTTDQATKKTDTNLDPNRRASENAYADDRYEEYAVDSVDLYLKEIGEVKLLSREKEIDLAKRIAQGDQTARKEMIEANLRLVVSVAKHFQGRGLSLQDLIQEGNVGLMNAIDRFDATQGKRLSTYAAIWIRQAISRAIANQGKVIRVPVNVIDLMNKIRKYEKTLMQTLGRAPSLEELAEAMNMKVEKIADAMCADAYAFSLDAPLDEESDASLGTVTPDSRMSSPEEIFMDNELAQLLQDGMGELDEREATVLRIRFGMYNGHMYTLEQVGNAFNVETDVIRQIERIAFRKLRYINSIRQIKQHYSDASLLYQF